MNQNVVHLQGKVVQDLKYSHTTLGEMFFKFTIGVKRMSGTVDELPVIISERVPGIVDIQDQEMISIDGNYRSRNVEEDGVMHCKMYVFATSATDEHQSGSPNKIYLEGYLCREPVVRVTPSGRTIADLTIAVNRGNGRTDFIPCIAWDRNASFAESLHICQFIQVCGRLQSRKFTKTVNGESVEKIAYEVSITSIQLGEDK